MAVVFYITDQREDLVKTRMKELRARDDLTQAKLAQLVGVRRETIVLLE